MKKFSFQLEQVKGTSRVGSFETPHGKVETPIFMPVGTAATVKALDSSDVEKTKAQIILANTYHLYLRPGMEVIQAAGGVHSFMNWDQPMLTDSGGYQVFSLGGKVKNEGVEFTSHLDGSKHFFTPETSIEIQRQIGADILMAFDECTPDSATKEYAQEALARTHQWAKQCYEYWEKHNRRTVYGTYQSLFGIVQGAMHPELRRQSAEVITSFDFDGIAVGGETIGYNMEGSKEVMTWIEQLLPADKPRYAMGLGRDPQDLIDAVAMGFDMFDCVGPTRLARNGALYVGELDIHDTQLSFKSDFPKGRLSIGSAKYAQDFKPIQADCDCATCEAGYSRAYLHHLYRSKELSYYRLASIHNVRFMIRLAHQIRVALLR